MVSFFRGAASARGAPFRGVSDPLARSLVPGWLALGLRAIERAPGLVSALRPASLGLLDHVALRTAAIDAALGEALARGARQLVVLGAGLDARAYRLAELAGVVVFEVDHPATQRSKRARLAALAPAAREVRFVGVDFERGSLERELGAAGHDRARPTAWIWEGVTPYLAPGAVCAMVGVIGALSAPASELLVTYLEPALSSLALVPRPALRAAFAALGEPVKAAFTPAELASLLREHELDVVADSGSPEWASRFLVGPRARITIAERLAVAIRRAAPPA
jgi:methyltransferase (TIGR00027 family)